MREEGKEGRGGGKVRWEDKEVKFDLTTYLYFVQSRSVVSVVPDVPGVVFLLPSVPDSSFLGCTSTSCK